VEWSNGFAEIIKYACIFDADLFTLLEGKNISHYKNDTADLINLVDRCANWKNTTVIADEHEKGIRKLLNFGHTAAHAIENLYELPHGKAVAIGMVIAAMLSEKISGLKPTDTHKLKELLELYNLPVHQKVNTYKAMEILKMDKKRNNENVDYIVLEAIGKAAIRSLPLTIIETVFSDYESHN
jgi:3-dehydroquinate synthase